MSLDSLCKWQVYVYCTRRINTHHRCTQCSILLHIIDICFLPYICLWQISQIQTCLRVVVRSGFVSILPAFMRSSDSHPAGSHGWLAQKTVYRALIGAGGSDTICQQFAKTAVTATPIVGCVVWSLFLFFIFVILSNIFLMTIDSMKPFFFTSERLPSLHINLCNS